jgi:acyl-coenzyme A thioesterase PaaI-like protein
MPSEPPAGFTPLRISPFVERLGGMYLRYDGETPVFGALVEPAHANTVDTAHGGYLLALADVAAARGARLILGEPLRTASLSMDFVAPVPLASWVELAVTVDHVRSRTVLATCRVTVSGALAARVTATLVTMPVR